MKVKTKLSFNQITYFAKVMVKWGSKTKCMDIKRFDELGKWRWSHYYQNSRKKDDEELLTCHGIMLQNIPSEPATDENMTDNQTESLLSLPKTGARSLKSLANDILPPCYMNKRDSPKITISHLALVE